MTSPEYVVFIAWSALALLSWIIAFRLIQADEKRHSDEYAKRDIGLKLAGSAALGMLWPVCVVVFIFWLLFFWSPRKAKKKFY